MLFTTKVKKVSKEWMKKERKTFFKSKTKERKLILKSKTRMTEERIKHERVKKTDFISFVMKNEQKNKLNKRNEESVYLHE